MYNKLNKTVSVEQAREILYAAVDYDCDTKGIYSNYRENRKHQVDAYMDIHVKKLRAQIGICRYLIGPNVDFPTKDTIEVASVYKIIRAYNKESGVTSFAELDAICGFTEGTCKFLCTSGLISHVNYDVVVHMSRRLIGYSTAPTDYEMNRHKIPESSYVAH
jgi:hypothetical protein